MQNDDELVRRVLEGDATAFEPLVTKYQGMVYAMARSELKDHEDAQDVCQETFIRAYRGLPGLRNRQAFAPWLFTIVRRACTDFLRGRLRMRQRETSIETCPPASVPATDPRSELASREDAEALWRLVGKLDVRSREVLLLHYGEGMKVHEIADLANLGDSTVKMRLAKARALLGERVGALKGALAAVPVSDLSSGVMQTIKASGPLKLATAGTAFIWGPLLVWSLFLGWLLGRDVERLRGQVPAALLRKARILIWCGVLFFPAYMGVMTLARRGGVSPYWVVIPFLLMPLFGCYIFLKNLLAFGTRRTKIKAMSYWAFAILVIVFFAVAPDPQLKFLALGLLFASQGLSMETDNRNGLVGAVHGSWLWGALNCGHQTGRAGEDLSEHDIRKWLSLLFQWGVVMAPLRMKDAGVSVCLRVRNPWRAWAPWLSHSRLRVSRSGDVSCEVVPADYVALFAGEDAPQLPGRRELQERLGQAFTASLRAFTESELEAATPLGLRRSEESARMPNYMLLIRYVVPAMGLLMVLLSLYELLFEA
ncbi:MAG: RNA polymerase sigma factor [Candidatus Hydrogenedentales bacterium]